MALYKYVYYYDYDYDCATTTRVQNIKAQRHTRPQIELDLQAWRRHRSQSLDAR